LRYCVLHNCRLHLIPKILAKYRVHQKQLTKEKATISLSQTNRIRKFILDKIEPEKRKKYESAIKEYQKTKSTAIRSRHMLRDTMFKILPRSVSSSILKSYMNRKE
ncbi:MAG: glycosyltransferase, partial [Thaumarchaeota archaeon]|nr:glycosyltransferase [Nitrososphaerota archaeon]